MPIESVNQKIVSVKDQRHLQSCSTCRENRAVIIKLQQSVAELSLDQPDESSWLKINERMSQSTFVKQPNKASRYRFSDINQWLAMAATVSLVFLGVMTWNNHRLQVQLTHALNINRSIELQLAAYSQPRFQQGQLLQRIRILEQKLTTEQSLQRKILLLTQRGAMMQKVYDLQKGQSNDFSI